MTHSRTPAIGTIVNHAGERWQVHRQDTAGNYWAKHLMEYSCSEILVTSEMKAGE